MANQASWYGQKVMTNVRKISLRKLRRVGRLVANKVKQNIAVPGPDPSNPGEYPHKQTGNLQAHIDYRMNLAEEAVEVISGAVDPETGAPYSIYLELKSESRGGRPYLTRTLKEMTESGEIQAAFDKA